MHVILDRGGGNVLNQLILKVKEEVMNRYINSVNRSHLQKVYSKLKIISLRDCAYINDKHYR